MEKNYLICGTQIHIDSNTQIMGGNESVMFESYGAFPIISIQIEAVDQIKESTGVFCISHKEHPVFRSGDLITRCHWDFFRKNPHIQIEYCLRNPSLIHCVVRKEDWTWATNDKYLWSGISIQSLLLHQNALIFHASYIVCKGMGILFTAPSGTGKSTQAALWKKYRDASIINGDKAGISIRDEIICHGVPFSGTSGISNNVSAPLRAIVSLSQGAQNSIRKLSVLESAQVLYRNCFIDSAIPEENQIALQLILKMVEKIPVYHLECTPDENAVITLEKALNLE